MKVVPDKKKFKNAVLISGQKVGQYTIKKKLSNGGFGVVYLAQRNDGYDVALKEFLPSILHCRDKNGPICLLSQEDQMRFNQGLQAFFREADTLSQVHNDKIIPIWDVFKENGTAYFAMPVEKGNTLHALMKNRKLSELELQKIFIQTCMGIEALHTKGLLHLDIKPGNLWVRPDGSVLILDLGASRWEDEEMKNLQMARTPGFAAPEQHNFKNYKDVNVKTDVYAICASLLCCLYQHAPTPANKRTSSSFETTGLIGQVSSDLLKIINKGMSLLPHMRYQSVKDLRKSLENLHQLKVTHINNENLEDPIEWDSIMKFKNF